MSESQLNQRSQIINEVELLEMLNINKATLDDLRENANFPSVRLNRNNRVYLLNDVMDWCKSHRRNVTA